MAYKFDENKYKKIFDQMYGKNSFDSGLSRAKDIGQAQVKAEQAKQQYNTRVKQEKAMKTYDDALNYWNDPKTKKELLARGVEKTENDIRNDPRYKAQIKAAGFSNLNDFIDAMYNASTNGKNLSKRQFKQDEKTQNFNVDPKPGPLEHIGPPKLDYNANLTKEPTPLVPYVQEQPKKEKKPKSSKKDLSILDNLKNFLTSKDTNNDGQRDGLLGLADRYILPISQAADEILLPGNEAMQRKNDKEQNHGKITNPAIKAGMVDRGTETKVLHGIGDVLGYTAPYGKANEGVNLALNALPKVASKLSNPFVQRAVKGVLSGTTAETGLAAENELVNPDAGNMGDYAKRIGYGALFAGVGDPALYGAGKAIGAASSKAMKGLLPDSKAAAQKLSDILSTFDHEQLPGNSSVNQVNPNAKTNVFLNRSKPINQIEDALPSAIQPIEHPAVNNPVYQDIRPSAPVQSHVDTSAIDHEINKVSQQIEHIKSQPNGPTKTQIDDQLRSLEINDGHLTAARRDNKISEEDFRRRYDENQNKRDMLLQQQKAFTHDVPDELKPQWNNETRSTEVGNYSMKQAYGGGFNVYKDGKVLQKFRTQEESIRFMQQHAAAENGLDLSFDKEGVLNWKSTIKEGGKGWNIQAGDYSMVKGPKGGYTLKYQDNPLGTFKSEQKAREVAQRHFDNNAPVKGQDTSHLENQLQSLHQQRESLLNPPMKEVPANSSMQNEVSTGLPKTTSNNLKERGHVETLRNSQNSTDSLKERLKGMYKPTTNEEALAIANKYIAQGTERATSFVKSAKVLRPEHVATAHRLIQEFQKTGQIEKAVDIAEHIAERGTKAGQAVQAFSIFDKLSPEGILIHANRIADRVNANLSPLRAKVTVTNEAAAQLTDLATTVQKMTEQKTVANDVINIMDKAKTGQKLTQEETKQIRQFVDDAKQWITDITPKKTKPKQPNKLIHPEVKKQIVNFLDSQEEAARKRLASRRNRALSGLPVDDFYDYAVIGASKLAKGTLNFAEFSEQMIREFGQEVAPHVRPLYDKALEMVNNEVKRTTQRLSEVEKITNKALKNGKLEASDADNLRRFALSINTMSGETKIESSQQLQSILQGLERPSLLQQISTAQTIGQLMNPKTLVRNAIGNEMFYRLERLNKFVATPIDIARSKVTGKARSVTFRTNNQAQYWNNWLRGWKAGLKGVNPEGLSTQYDLHPNAFNGKWNPLKHMERVLGGSLKSFDYAGYKRAVNNTIGELATLRAVNEGLIGQARKQAIEKYIREVDDNVLALADQYGKYVTFQDDNGVSSALQALKRGLNKHSTGSSDFGVGDLIIKYPKTPGSLLLRGLEYSPAGFLKSVYQIAKPFFGKEAATTREITESLTRALIGTGGIAAPAYVLADLGILTGGGSKDFDVKDLERSAGKQDYSFNVTGLKRWVLSGFNKEEAAPQKGDKFISYNWAQPLALSVAMSANVNQSVKESGQSNPGGAVVSALDGALDSMVGLSVLQGLQRALTTNPNQSLTSKGMDIVGQLPASFMPTFLNQLKQKLDNTSRSTYDPSKLNIAKNQAKNKVPGLASQLPPSYDTLGRKKEGYQGKSNTLYNVFLNPAFESHYNPSSEAKMVLDTINDTGDTSLAPRRAQKYMMVGGKKYDLNPKQYAEYQRRLGTEVRTNLQELQRNAGSYSQEELGKSINKILDDSGRKIRNELKQEFFGYTSKK